MDIEGNWMKKELIVALNSPHQLPLTFGSMPLYFLLGGLFPKT